MIATVLLYLAFGSVAGVLSGLFGIGGGAVIVPFLVWQLADTGFPPQSLMVVAVATSLATIVATSISAVYAHHRRGAVVWRMVAQLAPGILVGSVLGSMVAEQLPVLWFKLVFACFLLFVALRMGLGQRAGQAITYWPTSPGLLAVASIVIGTLSAILGIGGGTLSVPFLVKCRYLLRQAVAISSACGFPIAVAGTASYVVLGWNIPGLPPYSVGYVYLPAFLGIVFSSVLLAPLGAKLAHTLPTAQLKRIFALVLMLIGGKMLWSVAAGLVS